MGCESDLNGLLQNWITEKEKERSDNQESESNKENVPKINNPHKIRTKGAPKAPKKRVKSKLEVTTAKQRKCATTKNSQQEDHP